MKRSHGYSKGLIYLDVEGYMKAVRESLKDTMKVIKNDLVRRVKNRASALPFKDNEVRISGGTPTSDLKRSSALIDSIEGNLRFVERDVLELTVTAMETGFKDSHIGLYYEHGTGDEWDGYEYETNSVASPNKYRKGSSIVSRSMFIDYAGLGRGRWVDVGGNLRVTSSVRAGERDRGFVDYIGEDVKAYYWFSGTFKDNKERYALMIRGAIEKVWLGNYLILKRTFVLGKD